MEARQAHKKKRQPKLPFQVRRIARSALARSRQQFRRDISAVARVAGVPVTASGGVATLDDLRQLQALGRASGIDSVIVGKALYENRFTLAEARRAIAEG